MKLVGAAMCEKCGGVFVETPSSPATLPIFLTVTHTSTGCEDDGKVFVISLNDISLRAMPEGSY